MLKVRFTLCLLLLSLCVSRASDAGAAIDLRNGDLIFHKSQGPQAMAILEATGSPWSHVGIVLEQRGKWVVAEASNPVRIVSLQSFINRGRAKEYQIYRPRNLKPQQIPELRAAIANEIGKRYDIYFEWSDQAIYCSELVYKVFLMATGIELGTVQKFSDLRLDGIFVQILIHQRLKKTGRQLNLNEPIVTPISQMMDPDLDLIVHEKP